MTKQDIKLFNILIVLAVLIVSFVSPVNIARADDLPDYRILGDSVYITNDIGTLMVTPHTLTESGWVTVEFRSKKFDGEVDISFGYDDGNSVQVVDSELWDSRTEIVDDKAISISKWHKNKNPQIVEYYADNKWQSQRYDKSIHKNTWYQAKYYVDIPFNTSGKYNITVKPSGLTLSQAQSLGQLLLLDPWWDASYHYRKSFSINNTGPLLTDYQFQLRIYSGAGIDSGNVTYLDSHASNWPYDIRFTNMAGNVTMPHYREEYDANDGTWWVKLDSLAAGTDNCTFYMYYGNGGASDNSSGENTFIIFENFEWGNNSDPITDSGGSVTWTITAGDVDISTDQEYGDGTRSMKIIGVSSATMPVPTSNDQAIRFRVYKDNGARLVFKHDDNVHQLLCEFDDAENLEYYTAAWQDTGQNGQLAQWDMTEWYSINFTAATYNWFWQDTGITQTIANGVAMRNIGQVQNKLSLENGIADNIYIDNIYIRKFRALQPTWSLWGAEESEAVGTPTVTTGNATAIEEYSALLSGNIVDVGSANCTERGFQYDIDSGSPYADNVSNSGNFTTGVYSINATGLSPGELYYFRSYAINPTGIGYGSENTFLTKPLEPTNFTASAVSETQIDLEWTKGVATDNTVIRGKIGSFPSDVTDGTLVYDNTDNNTNHTGLGSGEHWYYRAWSWCTEGGKTQYSDLYDQADATTLISPSCSTNATWSSGETWAIVYGTQNSMGTPPTVTQRGFQYGVTELFGNTEIAASANFTTGEFYEVITGLKPGTLYYYRARVYNGIWASGETRTFATKDAANLEEYYNTGDDSICNIYESHWAAQTFSTNVTSHSVDSVKLKLARVGSPGDLTVQIKRGTDNLPTGQALASGTIDGDILTSDNTGTWYEVEMDNEVHMEQDTEYSIVLSAPSGTSVNCIIWRYLAVGAYSDGSAHTSNTSGVNWTTQNWDFMFEVMGKPSMYIEDSKVFTGYIETNDWLIPIRYVNLYPPYYDTYDIRKYFVIQLLDTDSNIKAQSVVSMWGKRVCNIYLSADEVTALEYGGEYRVRMIGLFSGTPFKEYPLLATDWVGSDLTLLDSWVITSATAISDYYDTAMTTYIAGRGEVLNATGGTIFDTGIAGLSTIRSTVFQTYSTTGRYTPESWTQTYRNSLLNWQANIGTDGTVMLTRLGNMVGIGGGTIAAFMLFILMVGIMVLAFPAGHTGAACILVWPIILAGAYFGVNFIFIGIAVLIAAFLLVKQFWIDKGA